MSTSLHDILRSGTDRLDTTYCYLSRVVNMNNENRDHTADALTVFLIMTVDR